MGMANAQDLAAGEQSFRKCSPCHAVGEDAKNKVGPALNGLDGRKSGTIGDYSYSEANKKAEITWSEASFKDYIQNPMAKVPGTKMAFAGIKNDKEIGDLWAYLKQFKADGSK
jgi:cytochrome c